MKVYGNIRLASVSGKGKTYSALKLDTIMKDKRDCKVLLIGREPKRK